jgi:hypothetical protein
MLDVNRFANRLLNRDRPEVIRAVDLYELQVGVFLQKKTLRDQARKYCAMMLLDHIEERDGVRKGDLAQAAALNEYCELFSEIMRERGWLGLSRFRSRHGFDTKLQHGIQNAKSLADAIDLVCRSAQEGQHLSLECAERVSRSRFQEVNPSGHDVAKSPARTKEEAVLIYLLLTHCADLLPPALKKDSFAVHLLQQVRDIAPLQKLFSANNRVLGSLLTVGQQLGRPLLLKGDEVETSILWKPLDVETKKLIDRYAGFHQLGVPSE